MSSPTPSVPARPAASASTAYVFPAGVTVAELQSAKTDIAAGSFSATASHVPAAVPAGMVADFVAERLPAEVAGMSAKYRTKIIGVDYSAIATALLTLLAISRKKGNYTDLFLDLNLAVATAYTVSRDTSDDYRKLGQASAFKEFEISGRTRSEDAKIAAKSAWTVSSNMNASALRLAGHLVVECAPNGGFLAQIKTSKGTPFSPVQGGKDLEALMRESSKQLNESDKVALESFRREFKRVLMVMDKVWGEGGASTEAAESAAASIAGSLL